MIIHALDLIWLVWVLVPLVGMAGMFHKAGIGWWWVIVPIVNFILFMRMIRMSLWWVVAVFFSFVIFLVMGVSGNHANLIAGFAVFLVLLSSYQVVQAIATARAFDASAWYALGVFLVPAVFYMILALGPFEYAHGSRTSTRLLPRDTSGLHQRRGSDPRGASYGTGWHGAPQYAGGAGSWGQAGRAGTGDAGPAPAGATTVPIVGWNRDTERPSDMVYWDGTVWTSRVTWDGQQWVTTWQR